jgi:TRAP-type C4-dicarboxylate transport system permease small subunit
VAVALLVAMFVSFLLQIFSRYIMKSPLGWTVELCLMCWVWLVFWGCAFLLKDRDHVTFDVVYSACPVGVRRAFALVSALAMLAALVVSLPDSFDYLRFIHIKKSAILRIPLDVVFSVYGLFMIALIIRHAFRIVFLLRGGAPDGDISRQTS